MRGTVLKRGHTWSVVLDVGRDGQGRRIRKWHSGYRTRKDAERARVELLASITGGTYVAPSKVTVAQFLVGEWLPAKRATVKETTLASYEMHVGKHIVPRLGGAPILSVSAAQLNSLYAELLAGGRRSGMGGLSPTTVRHIHATLHKALSDAVRWGRLPRNPADQADPPRPVTAEMSVWSPAQLRQFLDFVRTDRLFAAWLLAATTGMRRGELLGLRWTDVDLDVGTVSIRQIRTVARYEVLTLTPKTDKGVRTVAIDPQTVGALRSYRNAQRQERLALGDAYLGGDSTLVFTQEDGSPIHPERFSRSFARLCHRSGLPPIRLHDVRHSYVTALLSQGIPLKVVSQRVGHASPLVTMSIYQHVLPGDDRAASTAGAQAILGSG
jgi:integrase